MSFEKAKAYLESRGFADRILTFDTSSATVELAAAAVGTEPEKIAKSLTFTVDGAPLMILCAGDGKVSNPKYKACFGTKAKMLDRVEVSELIGHEVGGVCPFGINENVRVCLDIGLRRFETVYPACGSGNSAVRLSVAELESLCPGAEWVDVCKLPGED